MKKIKLLLTMAVIVFTTMICCSMSAFALTEGDWEFQLSNNEVTITKYVGAGGEAIIPETIYGCPVTKIEKAAFYLTNVGSIKINAKITEIPYNFAWQAKSLTEVTIPASVKEVGKSMFGDCKSLKSVIFEEGCETVSGGMFDGCKALEKVELANTITTIGSSAFAGCSSLKELVLPTGLKVINDIAFYGCSSLKELIIPYGVEEIWTLTFDNNTIKSIFIPDTVTKIERRIIDSSRVPNAIVYCGDGSAVAEHCQKNNISYLTDSSVNSGIHVLYNGERISFHSYSQNPEILEGRTLVPLRSIFEAMGADVEWDGATSTAIAKRGNVEVKITIGASEIYKNGKAIPVDVPAMLLNSRTMVPARVIAEAFGADVQWNGNGRIVLITE